MLRTGLGLCLAFGLAWCCAAGFDEKDKKDPVRNPLARNPAAIEAGGKLFRPAARSATASTGREADAART